MIITVVGGSSLPARELSKGLRNLFEDYGFGKVTVVGDNGQAAQKGVLKDETVEIDLTAFGG